MSSVMIMAGRTNTAVAVYRKFPKQDDPWQAGPKQPRPAVGRTRVKLKPHKSYWSEILDIYRAGSPPEGRCTSRTCARETRS